LSSFIKSTIETSQWAHFPLLGDAEEFIYFERRLIRIGLR